MLGFVVSGVRLGSKTAAAGTAIVRTIDPYKTAMPPARYFTRLSSFSYRAGATAHTLTVMKPIAATTLASAAAAAQPVIALTADPGSIAANDYLVIEKPDGTFHTAVVLSVAGLDITLTANVPAGGFATGAKVWFLGVPGDQSADDKYELPASATTRLADYVAGWNASVDRYEPIVLHVDNATNAGVMQQTCAAYCDR